MGTAAARGGVPGPLVVDNASTSVAAPIAT